MAERKPSWAWSSVDDPNPTYPKCDRCDAFARWSMAELEGNARGVPDWVVRGFACGRHLGMVLDASGDYEWMVCDITTPPERS